MRRCLHWLPLVCSLAWLGCACASEPDPVEAQNFCAALATAVCEGYESCCGIDLPGYDFEACRGTQRAQCAQTALRPVDINVADLGDNIDQGVDWSHLGDGMVMLDFDEDVAGELIAEIRGAAERCEVFEPVTVERLYRENEVGEPCDEDNECASPLACSEASTGAHGECVDPPTMGQACADRCADDLVCAADICAEREPCTGSRCRDDRTPDEERFWCAPRATL